jgi:uncharacterized membrane protein HdeD (DUF308 family)
MMDESLLRSWWIPALRGVIAILFGVLALRRPDISLTALVWLFAVYALLTAGVSFAGAFRNRGHDEHWWMQLLIGAIALGAGLIAIFEPAVTALTLVLLMGANAIAIGVLDIVVAIRLRKVLRNEWMLLLSGLAAIVFGVLVFLYPGAGALTIVWMIGVYALLTGVLLLSLAWRVKAGTRVGMPERRHRPDRRTTPAHP